jgi:glycosyltransferase involved in cell wall biosynthesis
MRTGFPFRTNFRRNGDEHRNLRNWPAAEAAYKRHLVSHPTDAAIHIQLGHALKEQRKLAEAVKAYADGASLYGNDADSLLHLGDALVGVGRLSEAFEAYNASYAIEPTSELRTKVISLSEYRKVEDATVLDENVTFFSIQDFFGYLKAHPTMSGIQRVQAGISLHALDEKANDIKFILNENTSVLDRLGIGEFWMIEPTQLRKIIDYASSTHVDHGRLKRLIADAEGSASRVKPGRGDTIILLGAFWGLGNTVERFVRSRENGVKIGAYIYDIIPVTHPEYCDANLARDFTMALCEVCLIVDFILTISDFTQDCVRDFVRQYSGRQIPIKTVALAHSLTGVNQEKAVWPEALRSLKGKDYVLYVSTVEGRKNHIYIINTWRQLMAEGVKVPDLVFVGRKGWRVDGLMDLLEASDYLGRRVHIVHDLSDGELNAVYEKCLFTVFTSFVEGWGLPVGESLLHGRPCVASNVASIPEVGGDLVEYIDPYNLRDGVAKIKALLEDRSRIRLLEARIKESFKPRTWADVGQDFLTSVRLLEKAEPLDLQYAQIGEGIIFRPSEFLSHAPNLEQYAKNPLRLLLGGSFYPVEPWGSWMRGAHGVFDIHTSLPPGTEVLVYAQMRSAPWAGDCRLRISSFSESGEPIKSADMVLSNVAGEAPVRMRMSVTDSGSIKLIFELFGIFDMPAGENRRFGVGLRAIGYAQVENVEKRQSLMEAFTVNDIEFS